MLYEVITDAIHSDGTITINGGSYEISSSDDGIHSDYDLVINDGNIDIVKSYEGIECYKGNVITSYSIHYTKLYEYIYKTGLDKCRTYFPIKMDKEKDLVTKGKSSV